MDYILSHKNIPLCELGIDNYSGCISSVNNVANLSRFPLSSTRHGRTVVDLHMLNRWWGRRAIPASRQHVTEVVQSLKLSGTSSLLSKSLGLSLSDHYWINPVSGNFKWEDVNFFQNGFSLDLGNILFGGELPTAAPDLFSPDSTTGGVLRKKWVITDGTRQLVKGSSPPFQQEPGNEGFASLLMGMLGIDHAPYSTIIMNGAPFSVCDGFVDPDRELVHAYDIGVHFSDVPETEGMGLFDRLAFACDTLGIDGFKPSMDRMLTVDFLLNNRDRHAQNFGFMRDPSTLKWLSFAPVYDSGQSLFNNMVNEMISEDVKSEAKPFFFDHTAQIKLVNDFTWIDAKKLNAAPEALHKYFNEYFKKFDMLYDSMKIRVDKLTGFLGKRISVLDEIANTPKAYGRPRNG